MPKAKNKQFAMIKIYTALNKEKRQLNMFNSFFNYIIFEKMIKLT